MSQFQVIQRVYGDSTVFINDLYIMIYKYYFPLGTSKTIFFDQIDQIIYHPCENKPPIWGVNLAALNDWFPLDELRKHKHAYFQIIMKGKLIKPCFSPIQPERAFMVLWRNHSKDGEIYRQSVQKQNQENIKKLNKKQNDLVPIQQSLKSDESEDDKKVKKIQEPAIKVRLPFLNLTNIAQTKKVSKKSGYEPIESTAIQQMNDLKENRKLLEVAQFEDLEQ